MKDFTDIIATYEKQLDMLVPSSLLAIGTIIGIEGNSFRRTGVRILVKDDGQWFSGKESAVFKGHILQQVRNAFKQKKAIIITIDTATAEGQDIGISLGYRGIIQFFISPIDEHSKRHPVRLLKKCLNEANHPMLLTIVQTKNRRDVNAGELYLYQNKSKLAHCFSDMKLLEAVHEKAQLCWVKGRSALHSINLQNSQVVIFYEILTHPPKLVLFGGQYDIYPLVDIVKTIGWRVTVVANPDKLRKSLFELVDEVIALEDTHLLQPDAHTAYILMSHIFERDMNYLIAATKTAVPYIGMLGPHKRFIRMFAQLADQGFTLSDQDKKRLHAPMGLNIGAATQEEIAIALIAEVRAFFSKRNGGFLKDWQGLLHDR